MTKQPLSRKRVSSEDYDSDGGFVEDAPKHKKSKITSASNIKHSVPEQQKDSDGNVYWEITRTRRLQVSEFKGNTMIGIREFYEKDAQMLPGKKGISLPLEQFNTFIQLLPEVESILKTKGINVTRPKYGLSVADDDAHERSTAKASSAKPNHEATSDEEDD